MFTYFWYPIRSSVIWTSLQLPTNQRLRKVMNLMKCVWRKSQSHNSLPKKLRRVHTFQHFPFSLNIEFGQSNNDEEYDKHCPQWGLYTQGKLWDSHRQTVMAVSLLTYRKAWRIIKTKKYILPLAWAAKNEKATMLFFPDFQSFCHL